MASMEDVRINFFQHKPFYGSSYSLSGKEGLCFQLIQGLHSSLSNNSINIAGRRRKLGEIGNLELFNPPKKLSRGEEAPPVKKLQEKRDLVNSLPDELLVEIFRFIPHPADRYSCASTCTRWLLLQSHLSPRAIKGGEDSKPISPGDELKRSLEGKRATDVKLLLTALGTQGRGGLGKLVIRGGPRQSPAKGVSNVGLSSVGICCGSLKFLSIWDCAGVSDAGFSWIGRGCSQLETLNVLNCPGFGDAGLRAIAAGCRSLASLSVENCRRIGDAGLEAVGKYSSRLSSLSVVGCSKVGDSGIVSVVSGCRELRALRMERVGVRGSGLRAIGELGGSIQKLKLAQLDLVSCEGFFLLGGNSSGMSQLKHLQIAACRGFSGDGALRGIGKSSPGLKLVSISGSVLRGSSLVELINDCSSLEALHIESCSLQVDSPVPVGVLNSGSSLKSLGVVNCTGGSSGFLASIAGGFTLTELDLSGEASLSDSTLVGLVGASLTRLNISGCGEITDRGVAEVIRLCPALASLALEGCSGVSDRGLGLIAGGPQALQELLVAGCFRVTDAGVSALLSAKGPELKTLSLAGCCSITERSLEAIEEGCPALEALNLKNCRGICREEVEMFESRAWKCLVCY